MVQPSYEYLPLQHDDSFRIIILHPSPNESDPIACTILRERLSDESVKYEAVSYTWGDNTETKKINLNGDTEQIVGKNCHAALRRLRRSDEDRSIWIDAICINQNDLNERSRQVRLMNEIYTLAAGVMVMLSDQVPDCRLLLREVATPKTAGSPQPTRTVLKQLEELFEDPWFKRTWVLQEVYEKKKITVMYGSATIPLHILEGVCYGYPRSYENAMKLTRGVLPRPLELLWTRQVVYSTPQFNLWNRLYISRECLASNPRDKVFALKSLLGYRQSEIDYLIDYTQSLEELFEHVAEFLLPVLGIRILAATRHPHKLDMPSWMPDWSKTLPLQSLVFQFESEKARMLRTSSVYATADDRDLTLQSYSRGDCSVGPELHLAGCRYAQLVKSSQVFHFLDTDDADRQMLKVYNDFVNRKSYLDATGQRKLIPSSTLSHFGRKIFHVLSRMSSIDLHYSLTRACGTYGKPIYVREEIEDFYQALQLCKVSLLNNGELATVPSDAQSGDVVCILKGALAPCLLRTNRNGSWKLVSGDCFLFETALQHVSGLDTYVRSNQYQIEEFILR